MKSKELLRESRHVRVRRKVYGEPDRPRLNVFRSLYNLYAQLIDDRSGKTLVAASTLDAEVRSKVKSGGTVEAAKAVGALIAERAKKEGIRKVVFDRGGYQYHGRVKALAEAAREGGLEF